MSHRTGKIILCLNCDAPFYAPKWATKNGGGKFCSHKCYGEWRGKTYVGEAHPAFIPRVAIICATCGREFICKNYELEYGRKFCSYECYHKSLKLKKGPLANNWQGGKSLEPYPEEFNNQKKWKIKKRDGYRCAECGMPRNKTTLQTHHIDYIKSNCIELNLITLCLSCHCKSNFNREYWQKRFMKKIEKLLKEEVS